MTTDAQPPNCPCLSGAAKGKAVALKVVPSASLSVLIAFFPKCPMCWAVYMSMFGSLGLAKLPYVPWLLPLLLACMALHLFMLWRKIPNVGWWPLVLSVAGFAAIISVRMADAPCTAVLVVGMSFIVGGSLLNGLCDLRRATR